MTKWFQWIVLTSITGSPLFSIVILVIFWWSVDRFTFHMLPDPIRGIMRWQRASYLRRTIQQNPNDRRSRYELADILVQQRRYEAAEAVLRPIVESAEEGVPTLFLFAIASSGAKKYDQAERVMLAALDEDPDHRGGDILLELGRIRLAKNDLAGAADVLEKFVAKRRSTIEGRVLLAKVRERAGDRAAAQRLRAEAWNEYASSPPAHRRRDRAWAWRAKPVRPAAYLVVAVALAVLFARFGAPVVREAVESPTVRAAKMGLAPRAEENRAGAARTSTTSPSE
jgi:tetratricopeptide (TPR) repeat protein